MRDILKEKDIRKRHEVASAKNIARLDQLSVILRVVGIHDGDDVVESIGQQLEKILIDGDCSLRLYVFGPARSINEAPRSYSRRF